MGSFSLVHWVIFGVIAYGIWRAFAGVLGKGKGAGEQLVCTTCGHHGPTVSHTRGSLLLEVVLWCMLIVPGVIYSFWRLSTRGPACSQCGGRSLVPANTPVGKQLLAGQANTGGK